MLNWLIDANNSSVVGAISFVIGTVGTIFTILGLVFTFREAKRAVSAAAQAQAAVESFKFRVTQHDAGRDAAEASYALEITRRHLNNGSWIDASYSYEDARRAIIRITMSVQTLADSHRDDLRKMSEQIRKFCDKIDSAQAGTCSFPDIAKAKTVIRRYYETLEVIKKHIEEAKPNV